MNEVQIKTTEAKLLLYQTELKHANKLRHPYIKLVKEATALLTKLKEA